MKTTARMLCLAALVTALTLTSGCSSKDSKQPTSAVTDPPAAAQTTAAATEEAKAEATSEPEKGIIRSAHDIKMSETGQTVKKS